MGVGGALESAQRETDSTLSQSHPFLLPVSPLSLVVFLFLAPFLWTEGMQSQKHRNELPLCTFCSAGGYRYG